MLNKLAFALAALSLGSAAPGAFSQTVTDIQAKREGSAYAQDVRGTILRTQYGLCWRTGYWTPQDAVIGCDGQLEPPVAKVIAPAIAAPAPVAAAPASAAPAPVPPKRCDFAVTLTNGQAFAYNKASLNKAAKKRIDEEVIGKLGDCAKVDLIVVTGHSDRLGSAQYNQKLSQKRAAAVAGYLKARGMSANINTVGAGATQPIKTCGGKLARKKLIECLAPNRRVVIEAQGRAE